MIHVHFNLNDCVRIGYLILISIKGGDLDVEIKQAGKKVNVQDISSFYEEEFFETKKVLLIKAKCPSNYLRRSYLGEYVVGIL